MSAKHRDGRVIIGLILAAVITGLASPAFAQATKWPAFKFKIADDKTGLLVPRKGKIDINKDHKIEAYLERIGGTYYNSGFTAPQLPIKIVNGEKTYIVNLSDLPDTQTVATTYAPVGASPDGLMVLDTSRIYGEDRIELSPMGYAVLGHELFHAIQNGYQIKQKHSLGTWITEGTAQAVGQDLFFTHAPKVARMIKPTDSYFVPTERWGGRNYAKPLRVKHGNVAKKYSDNERSAFNRQGYQSASLWRYIDDYIQTSGSPNLHPPKKPDYSYLANFFAHPMPTGGSDEENELKWLEENIKNHTDIKLPLSVIYAKHVTDLAYYVPDRTKNYALHKDSFADAPSISKWEKAVFGSCKAVILSDTQRSAKLLLSFSKVSARCIEVFFEGTPKDISVVFALPDANKEDANSLRTIGVQAKLPNDKAEIRIEPVSNFTKTDGSPGAQWVFRSLPFVKRGPRTKRSNVFILSNIADKVASTNELKNVEIKITYPVSMGEVTTLKAGQ